MRPGAGQSVASCSCGDNGKASDSASGGCASSRTIHKEPLMTLSWAVCDCGNSDMENPPMNFVVGVPENVGWWGIGWGGEGMKNSDMFLSPQRGAVVQDYFSEGMAVPTLDAELGGRNSLISVDSIRVDGRIYHSFSRLLKTGDNFDFVPSRSGPVAFIYTIEDRGAARLEEGEMPQIRGRFQLSAGGFYGNGESHGVEEVSRLQNVRLIHGSYMSVGWVIFMPIGLLIARYGRHRKSWLNMHGLLTKIGAGGTFTFVIVAIATAGGTSGVKMGHRLMGFIFSGIVIVTALTGLPAKLGYKNEAKSRSGKSFRKLRIFHNVAGWICVVFGVYQSMLGFRLYFDGVTTFGAFDSTSTPRTLAVNLAIAFIGLILAVTIIFLEARRCMTGHYTRRGGCCYSCGRIYSKDDNLARHISARNSRELSTNNSFARREVSLAVPNVSINGRAGNHGQMSLPVRNLAWSRANRLAHFHGKSSSRENRLAPFYGKSRSPRRGHPHTPHSMGLRSKQMKKPTPTRRFQSR